MKLNAKAEFNNIKAVIFDLDGTLLDSLWVWTEIDINFLNKRGIDVPYDYSKFCEGKTFKQVAEYTIERFNLPETPIQLMDEWSKMAITEYSKNVFIKPNAKEYLFYVKESRIKTAVVTSLSRHLLEPCLANNNIENCFDFILTTDEFNKGKTDADIFLFAAKKLEVPIENCIVFDDVPEVLKAAKVAGSKTCAVLNKNSKYTVNEFDKIADAGIDNFLYAPKLNL